MNIISHSAVTADCYLFKDDVNVTSDKLSNLLSLSGLHWVVTVLVVSKVLKAEQRTAFD